jgi:hypothetical protein
VIDHGTRHLGNLNQATVVDFGDEGPGRQLLPSDTNFHEVATHFLRREGDSKLAIAALVLFYTSADLSLRGS